MVGQNKERGKKFHVAFESAGENSTIPIFDSKW